MALRQSLLGGSDLVTALSEEAALLAAKDGPQEAGSSSPPSTPPQTPPRTPPELGAPGTGTPLAAGTPRSPRERGDSWGWYGGSGTDSWGGTDSDYEGEVRWAPGHTPVAAGAGQQQAAGAFFGAARRGDGRDVPEHILEEPLATQVVSPSPPR